LRQYFIAEVKTQSPFGFRAKLSWEALLEMAIEHGDAISIHTDARWGGSFNLVARARKATKKFILAKGIHETDDHVKKALAAGANAVLVVGREAEHCGPQCWYEPRFIIDLERCSPGTKVVWNTRDLRCGSPKVETWERARSMWRGWMCQASNIRKLTDVRPDADAFLVGEHLPAIVKELTQ
jgi:indole-3-glycerol phosphate synthase